MGQPSDSLGHLGFDWVPHQSMYRTPRSRSPYAPTQGKLPSSLYWPRDESSKAGMDWSCSDHTTGIEGSEPRSVYIDTQGDISPVGNLRLQNLKTGGCQVAEWISLGAPWNFLEISWKTAREALGQEWTGLWVEPELATLSWLCIFQTHSRVLVHLLVGGCPDIYFKCILVTQ